MVLGNRVLHTHKAATVYVLDSTVFAVEPTTAEKAVVTPNRFVEIESGEEIELYQRNPIRARIVKPDGSTLETFVPHDLNDKELSIWGPDAELYMNDEAQKNMKARKAKR